MPASASLPPRHARCPQCGRETAAHDLDPATLPFCSIRCRQVDLGRWLSGGCALPALDEEDDFPSGSDAAE